MICASILFANKNDVKEFYSDFENASGFIISIDDSITILTDEIATETNNWQRQIDITDEISKSSSSYGLSLFSIGKDWAISISQDDQTTTAVYSDDFNDRSKEKLINDLSEIMNIFTDNFGIDSSWINESLGALYLGSLSAEEFFDNLLVDIFGISPFWINWSYYEAIPRNLITDPDLAYLVSAIGNAKKMI